MKIAVASMEGMTISPHFGRSAFFVIFDIVDGKIGSRDIRPNAHTAFARGECAGKDHHHHDTPHSHDSVINALRDCAVVLCRGIGHRASEELKRSGIEPFVMVSDATPEEAVSQYLSGQLTQSSPTCGCGG
jgi:predicted Fe-Mo cluster-binding NifX family protein